MASGAGVPSAQAKPDIVQLSIALVSGLALALTTIFMCAAPLTNHISGARDFVIYWATGQQLAHRADPFDADAMTRIEHGAGLPDAYNAGFMRNPPWSLPLALPLGFVPLRVGTLLWSVFLLACLLYSIHLLRLIHGLPDNQLHWLGLSFAPALLCLLMGQTSLFCLLGFVLFLRHHRTHPFLAGASLWLCMLKPHLFLPFGVVLLAWIVVTKSYKVLAGAVVALAASCALVYCLDPTAFSHYLQMIRTVGVEDEFIPCLSIGLRFWISEKTMGIQWAAPALACMWALGYYWRRRHAWDWLQEGGMLMVVSIFAAPYCFLYDQGLVIPGLLQGAYVTRSRTLLVLLALCSIVVEAELITGVRIHAAQYLWTAGAWLVWYLLAVRFRTGALEEPGVNAVIPADGPTRQSA